MQCENVYQSNLKKTAQLKVKTLALFFLALAGIPNTQILLTPSQQQSKCKQIRGKAKCLSVID